jgi:hypothetical protein
MVDLLCWCDRVMLDPSPIAPYNDRRSGTTDMPNEVKDPAQLDARGLSQLHVYDRRSVDKSLHSKTCRMDIPLYS